MFETKVNGKDAFEVSFEDGGFFLNGESVDFDMKPVGKQAFQVLYRGGSYTVYVEDVDRDAKTVRLRINGKSADVTLYSELDRLLKKMGLDIASSNKVSNVKAPMPGLIHAIKVSEGQEVEKGDPLLILEAMKMENVIKSPAEGKVGKIHVNKGQNVDKGTIMISFA